MTTQRPLNSTYAPKIGRDGAPKNIAESIPVSNGMRNRTAEHSLIPGFSNPLDDESLQKKFLDGKAPAPHPGMVSKTQSERGTYKGPDHGSDILTNAANLGRPTSEGKVINRHDNGSTSDGGSRPVTTRD
jgi:hypothetical protein